MSLSRGTRSNWNKWYFYSQVQLIDTVRLILDTYSLDHFLSPTFPKKTNIYLNRQDTSLQLSICIRLFDNFIIWSYWERKQGIMSHRVSLQYHKDSDTYFHIADLIQTDSCMTNKILSVIPGYKDITLPYTSFYKFIVTEQIPIDWKRILGFVNSLKDLQNVKTHHPTRLILECYQSGNSQSLRDHKKKITRTFFWDVTHN